MAQDDSDLIRTERRVTTPDGLVLALREIRLASGPTSPVPLLLLHGARVPGPASFDLGVPGGSLAADLARDGHVVYLLDLRGYGDSTRPPEMEQPPAQSAPLVRTADAVSDLAAAVEALRGWSGRDQVALIGWATGGHWCAAYAGRQPATVARLVLINTLYGGSPVHPTLGSLDVAALGGYRLNTADSLFPAWDQSIPLEDKALWRDPLVAAAYAEAALASDPTAATRQPPSFRAPSGALADSHELALGRKQWQAADLAMPVLVIRCGRDFWSRPEDAEAIVAEAPEAELVLLPEATHFVHLDRGTAGRDDLLAALRRFLG